MAEASGNFMISLLVAVIGLFGSLVVAYLTASSTRSIGLSQRLNEMRQKTYTEFFEGQTLLWKSANDQDRQMADRKIVSAKFGVLLVGSKDTICSMVNYWRLAQDYRACPDFDLRLKDAAIYKAMRKESFESLGLRHPELDPAIVVAFLWDCLPPDAKSEDLCRSASH